MRGYNDMAELEHNKWLTKDQEAELARMDEKRIQKKIAELTIKIANDGGSMLQMTDESDAVAGAVMDVMQYVLLAQQAEKNRPACLKVLKCEMENDIAEHVRSKE
jgi:D-Tyr-tRNAtyr deacylase